MKLAEVSRGITHFEDLPHTDIVGILSDLGNYQITEKVDGAQILFGIDENGFYTSRETKGGERIYNEENYGITFSSTYMRSVHRLLEQVLPTLKAAGLRPGDQVEAEVLYGQVPNVVPYSADTNYLIFLRTTEGAVNIDRLKQKLDDRVVSVSLVSPFTDDGKSVVLREHTNSWKFARVPIIESNYDRKLIQRYVYGIEHFLNLKDAMLMQTCGRILETPLNKIPDWVEPSDWKWTKEYLKERREEIRAELDEKYILPLKTVLLESFVRNAASSFGPLLEDGGWIEGVVFRHIDTGKMFKLVDKDVFSAVREFAWEKRNMLAEKARSIEGASSFLGKLYLDMATSIGHPELGTMQAKSYLRKAGTITEERIQTLSSGINFKSVKMYWQSLLECKEEELFRHLDKYAKEENILSARSNRFLATAVKERTMQTFAETFQRINEMQELTFRAKSIRDLFQILVGKQLGEI